MEDQGMNIQMSREAHEAERLIRENRDLSGFATHRLSAEVRALENALATARVKPAADVARRPASASAVATSPSYHAGAIRWVRAIIAEASMEEKRELLRDLLKEFGLQCEIV